MADLKKEVSAQVIEAYQQKQALYIQGSSTKDFYGRNVQGDSLSLL